MPFNSSGTFTLDSAAFVPNTLIQSAAVNLDFSGIATGLTQTGARTLNPSITMGSIPASATFGGPTYSIMNLADNLNNGASYLVGDSIIYQFGGSTTFGGRIARFSAIYNNAATASSNTLHQYIADQGFAYTNAGDGGTNTSSGAKGDWVATYGLAVLDAGGTNVNSAVGSLFTLETVSGSSYRYGACVNALGFFATAGATWDAAYLISAETAHIGFKYGLLFSDYAGANPFKTTTTIIGANWGGATPTVTNGVDFSNITFSGSAFKTTGFSVTGAGSIVGAAALSVATTNTQTGATYSVDSGASPDFSIIANRAGTITMTLPAAASFSGRILMFLTIQNQTVVSATSNVIPLAGGAAGTAILAGTAGKWAMLQSTGSNWQIIASN